jgi:hypothetical protein
MRGKYSCYLPNSMHLHQMHITLPHLRVLPPLLLNHNTPPCPHNTFRTSVSRYSNHILTECQLSLSLGEKPAFLPHDRRHVRMRKCFIKQ